MPRALSELPDVSTVVAVNSCGYAYPSFAEGVVHLAAVLARTFPRADVHLLSGDGTVVAAADAQRGDPSVVGPLAFTNPMGAVHLARRTPFLGSPSRGVVIDTGGMTSGTTILVDDVIEIRDRARHTLHRIADGKLAWFGVQTTPLDALASSVSLDGVELPIAARGVPFENVAVVLELFDPEHARKLAFFGLLPSRDEALRALADALALDRTLVDDDALLHFAREMHACAIERLGALLRRAIVGAEPRALLFGLGARALARPALALAGMPPEAIILAEDHLPRDLAEVASCYGAFHFAAELALGRRLEVPLE